MADLMIGTSRTAAEAAAAVTIGSASNASFLDIGKRFFPGPRAPCGHAAQRPRVPVTRPHCRQWHRR